MKRIVLLFVLIPLLSMTIENDNKKFVGKWIGEADNKIGSLIFDSDGYAYFDIQGEIIGGKEFVKNGQKANMNYEINNEVNSIQVDFIVTLLESKKQHRLLCIAHFINDDTMKFAMGFDNVRPTEFDSENSIILKREK